MAQVDLPDSFSTARLVARNWQATLENPTDRRALEAALGPLLTPAVTAHLPPSLQLDPDAGGPQTWVDAIAQQASVYTLRDGDGLAGLLILACPDPGRSRPMVHLGYLFAQDRWGKGLATELLSGLTKALSGRRLCLSGGVGTGNPASARVLVKAGFTRDHASSTDDTDTYLRHID